MQYDERPLVRHWLHSGLREKLRRQLSLVLEDRRQGLAETQKLKSIIQLLWGQSTYWMEIWEPSASCSEMHPRFTLWVREMCLNFGEYPFLATKIVAWLSSWMTSSRSWRPSSSDHRDNAERPSWYSEWAKDTISDSVVLRDTDVCLLDSHAKGKNEFGPLRIRYPQMLT